MRVPTRNARWLESLKLVFGGGCGMAGTCPAEDGMLERFGKGRIGLVGSGI
jgi:hypothetical protein